MAQAVWHMLCCKIREMLFRRRATCGDVLHPERKKRQGARYCAQRPGSGRLRHLFQGQGFGTVEQVATERLNKDVKWPGDDGERDSVRSAVKELLASPLSADNAVQAALLNNPGLQATYAELGIAEADLVQAGRMTNPVK